PCRRRGGRWWRRRCRSPASARPRRGRRGRSDSSRRSTPGGRRRGRWPPRSPDLSPEGEARLLAVARAAAPEAALDEDGALDREGVADGAGECGGEALGGAPRPGARAARQGDVRVVGAVLRLVAAPLQGGVGSQRDVRLERRELLAGGGADAGVDPQPG